MADFIEGAGNAQDASGGLQEILQNIVGSDLAGQIKTIGSLAAGAAMGEGVGTLVTLGTAPFIGPFAIPLGALIGIGAGYVASEVYKDGFDKLASLDGPLGGLIYDALHYLNGRLEEVFDNLSNVNTYRIVYIRDPLVLDLDGDGIETVAANGFNGVLFDNNNDGIKMATGWIDSDDSFLVRDLNGNGLIDSGAEQFGDTTALSNGALAFDGFAALADLDSNGDGIVNVQDSSVNALS